MLTGDRGCGFGSTIKGFGIWKPQIHSRNAVVCITNEHHTSQVWHPSSNDMLLKLDFYRLTSFSKDAIDQNNLEASVVFQAIENIITFYLMKLNFDKTYVLTELATIELPTTLEKLPTMLIALDPIIKVCMLYESLCRVTTDVNYNQMKHPSLPMYQIEDVLNKTRSKKRRATINFHK